MMREILFRGKRMDNGEWVYGWLGSLHCCNAQTKEIQSVYFTEITESFACRLNVIVDYKTVGQYTGFTDKNGVKIFEGDIISYFNKDILNSEVIYKNGCFMFRFLSEYTQRMRQSKQEPIFGNVSVCGEIIGNIHDNSELLKGA